MRISRRRHLAIPRHIKDLHRDYETDKRLPQGLPGTARQDQRTPRQTALRLLLEDFHHPSLRLKELGGTDYFEIRISKEYRLTLRLDKGVAEHHRAAPMIS